MRKYTVILSVFNSLSAPTEGDAPVVVEGKPRLVEKRSYGPFTPGECNENIDRMIAGVLNAPGVTSDVVGLGFNIERIGWDRTRQDHVEFQQGPLTIHLDLIKNDAFRPNRHDIAHLLSFCSKI